MPIIEGRNELPPINAVAHKFFYPFAGATMFPKVDVQSLFEQPNVQSVLMRPVSFQSMDGEIFTQVDGTYQESTIESIMPWKFNGLKTLPTQLNEVPLLFGFNFAITNLNQINVLQSFLAEVFCNRQHYFFDLAAGQFLSLYDCDFSINKNGKAVSYNLNTLNDKGEVGELLLPPMLNRLAKIKMRFIERKLANGNSHQIPPLYPPESLFPPAFDLPREKISSPDGSFILLIPPQTLCAN